jgi:glycosyltransferase involved in cell wall biosynthesis
MSDVREPISVIVPTKDRAELLDQCLRALRASLSDSDELIVADSASRDDSTRDLSAKHRATYIRCEQPGASRARNTGWRQARNQVIAFIDDDVLVDPGWADAVARMFAASPDVAFMTGRIGLKPEQAGTERPVALIDDDEARAIDAGARGTLGHSANMVVRRDALERVGGFDHLLGAGGELHGAEDYDLIDRLLAAGYRGRYEPTLSAVHEQWRDRRALVGLEWRYGIGLGARLAKLLRSDRSRARRVARELFWDAGARRAASAARQRYEFGVLIGVLHALGGIVGLARGLTIRVRNGHYVDRRDRVV